MTRPLNSATCQLKSATCQKCNYDPKGSYGKVNLLCIECVHVHNNSFIATFMFNKTVVIVIVIVIVTIG